MRHTWRLGAVGSAALIVALLSAGPAGAKPGAPKATRLAAPASAVSVTAVGDPVDIVSSGPLEHIWIGQNPALTCQVKHTGDSAYEWYHPSDTQGDCGTWLYVNGDATLYGPYWGDSDWTLTNQTAVTGTGTSADPFQVVTDADAGTTGIHVQQTDRYVVGEEAYRTDVKLTNNSAGTVTGVLYRAADCYLAGSDAGFGIEDATTGAVGCREGIFDSESSTYVPGDRVEEWVPITGGSSYYEEGYFTTLNWMPSQHTVFPSTCACDEYQDNGSGISWPVSLAPGAHTTFSQLTAFSPTGNIPLSALATADSDTANAGGTDGYTITIHNPNTVSVPITSITDTLPDGFTYQSGSSSGATSGNPTISGNDLTWSGSPLTSAPAGGDVTLDFGVDIAPSADPGDYYDEATADAGEYSVAPTGPTAPVTVTVCQPPTEPFGTSSSDKLVGTSGSDLLFGAGGKDFMDGLGGNDQLCGGLGGDQMYGRAGSDNLQGAGGNDRLFGGPGDDHINGGPGHDAIFAGTGTDTINANDDVKDCIVASLTDTINSDSSDIVITDGTGGCPAGFWRPT